MLQCFYTLCIFSKKLHISNPFHPCRKKFPYIHTNALLQACINMCTKKIYEEKWEKLSSPNIISIICATTITIKDGFSNYEL